MASRSRPSPVSLPNCVNELLESESPREGPDNNIQNTLHAPLGRAELRAVKLHK